MTINIIKSLELLNKATGRTYTIQERGMAFSLTMPNGGEYPPCDAIEMVERLIRMRIAAEGRVR